MSDFKTKMSWPFLSGQLREMIREALNGSAKDVLLTRKEACEFLKCSSTTLYYQMRDSGLPFSKLGRKLLFSKAKLIKFISVQSKKS